MRLILIAAVTALFALAQAAADQYDPQLDVLFKELRGGTMLEADSVAANIIEIWSDAPSDTTDVLFERAETAASRGQWSLAEVLLNHVTGLSPSFAQGFVLRATVRRRAGDVEGALKDFDTALSLEPRQFVARYQLAQMLNDSGEYKAAYDMVQSALEWNPHMEEARRLADELRKRFEGQEI